MHEQRRLRFAADLCTFYAPAFWGADAGFDLADIFAGRWEPLAFWERILDSARDAGYTHRAQFRQRKSTPVPF